MILIVPGPELVSLLEGAGQDLPIPQVPGLHICAVGRVVVDVVVTVDATTLSHPVIVL